MALRVLLYVLSMQGIEDLEDQIQNFLISALEATGKFRAFRALPSDQAIPSPRFVSLFGGIFCSRVSAPRFPTLSNSTPTIVACVFLAKLQQERFHCLLFCSRMCEPMVSPQTLDAVSGVSRGAR